MHRNCSYLEIKRRSGIMVHCFLPLPPSCPALQIPPHLGRFSFWMDIHTTEKKIVNAHFNDILTFQNIFITFITSFHFCLKFIQNERNGDYYLSIFRQLLQKNKKSFSLGWTYPASAPAGVRAGGIHQEINLPSWPSFQQHFRPLCQPMCTKPIVNISAPPSPEYLSYASTQTALPAIPTPCSYAGTNQNTANQREQKGSREDA